jgi:hypothetical protein
MEGRREKERAERFEKGNEKEIIYQWIIGDSS